MLKTHCELYFLKVERFSFGNVKRAKLSERLLSTIYHTNKKWDSFDPRGLNLLRENSICMVNLLEISPMTVFFNYMIKMLRLFQERSCVLSS